jgi:hypothetical protein
VPHHRQTSGRNGSQNGHNPRHFNHGERTLKKRGPVLVAGISNRKRPLDK